VDAESAKKWIAVARDGVLVALGAFIIVYEIVWGNPPKPVIFLAGIALLAGGRRAMSYLLNGGK